MEKDGPMACQKVQKQDAKVKLNNKYLFFHTKETVSQNKLEVYIYLHFIASLSCFSTFWHAILSYILTFIYK